MANEQFSNQGGLGDMMNIVKQAKRMQQDMEKVKERMKGCELSSTSGGGAVTISSNALKQIQSIKISPEVVDPSDVSTLEDLIIVALTGVFEKADEVYLAEMNKVTGGIDLPFPV